MPGFVSSVPQNIDLVIAKNFDFSDPDDVTGTGHPKNTMTLDGQLIIGSTALNAGGTHCNVATLTSGTGITITNGPGSITIGANGSVIGQTITGDSGGALSPTGGNWNILGQDASVASVMDTNGSGSTLQIENRAWQSQFIVDPSTTVGSRGTYSTVQAAITAASSGATVFIRPGTYTENLTLKAGVNLCGWPSDGDLDLVAATSNVTIVGTCTLTGAGTVVIANLRLQTNSAALLAVTGVAASIVFLKNCYLNCSNNTGITGSSTGGEIHLLNCSGNLGTTGIAYFALSNGCNLEINGGIWGNSGGSTTNNTWSAGILTLRNCEFNSYLTSSGTAATGNIYTVFFNGGGNNVAVLTHGSTSATPTSLWNCNIFSGTASAISVSAGASLSVTDCTVDSSNTNAITGAGTIEISNITFSNTSSVINTTTQTYDYVQLGKYKAHGQPTFSAYNSASDADQTGDGTVYTVICDTEVFDIGANYNNGTGVFTAPVTGRYMLIGSVLCQQVTAAMTSTLSIATTARTYTYGNTGTSFTGNMPLYMCAIADMTAGNTASMAVTIGGGAKVVDIYGGSDMRTFFQGYLLA